MAISSRPLYLQCTTTMCFWRRQLLYPLFVLLSTYFRFRACAPASMLPFRCGVCVICLLLQLPLHLENTETFLIVVLCHRHWAPLSAACLWPLNTTKKHITERLIPTLSTPVLGAFYLQYLKVNPTTSLFVLPQSRTLTQYLLLICSINTIPHC